MVGLHDGFYYRKLLVNWVYSTQKINEDVGLTEERKRD
jgi:hypothetical protein